MRQQPHWNHGKPLLLWLSLTNFLSSALRDDTSILMEAGLYAVVTFENGGAGAGFTSPLRVKTAITIGDPETMNTIADFSKFGWESTTNTSQVSETSMATPYVAGLVAYPFSIEESASPATISELIK
ncbi:hypothetical protein DL96DRAFT_1748376 [Flagelloscypha sp. PMI_526]|nr:hypothetical protein DL96DRAFT_1748376 [Flagelloscypha sp. PMI_526]